jgi:hypothetical protein
VATNLRYPVDLNLISVISIQNTVIRVMLETNGHLFLGPFKGPFKGPANDRILNKGT